jgi:Na+/H+-dicarboxylate symporter
MTGRAQKVVLYGIVAGVLLGGFCGWFFGPPMAQWKFVGKFFLNALFVLIVPLVFFSMVSGVAALGDLRKVGRTGALTMGYFLGTTLLAVVLGLVLVNVIEPGRGFESHAAALTDESLAARVEAGMGKTPGQALQDVLFSIVPKNIMDAASRQELLAVIAFALFFGGVLTTLGERGRVVVEFCRGADAALMKMVHLVMYLAPLGIFALVASRLGEQGGGDAVWREAQAVGLYAGTVIAGLLLHGFLLLPLLLWILTKRNPLAFTGQMAPALLTAFSTASSSATLPVTIRCCEERAGISPQTTSFVVPLGATVNMNGTALYEAVAAVFVGQAFAAAAGIHLGAAQMVIIALTSTLAAIGAAGIPEAGLVTMLIVFNAAGYPPEVITAGLASILTIDWFLDRCRTAVNVWGDMVGVAVVEKWAPPRE